MSDTTYTVDECFLPVTEDRAWGIYDTEKKLFVRCVRSGKSTWAKEHHAACAFANAVSGFSYNYRHRLADGQSQYIKDNPRYKVVSYSSTETYKL